jgi:hypothetical protein
VRGTRPAACPPRGPLAAHGAGGASGALPPV